MGDDLSDRALSYDSPGATRPADRTWTGALSGFRRYESSVLVGRGAHAFEAASQALLHWGVKTRSGFRVEPAQGSELRVREEARYHLVARLGPVAVREPVQVVAVVDTPTRRGFAYGTLTGHPVSGEEAFVVDLAPGGEVRLVLRSLTRPAPGPWRLAFPALLVAQRWYRARYRRALLPGRQRTPVVDEPQAPTRGTMPG
nr:DUF1990 domain-containing protein [Quadrisphaera sp. INWT6]